MATSSGPKANWNIKPLPKAQRVEPRKGTLRAQALAKMQKGGITRAGAVALCRAFDRKRGKKTNEDTIRGRAWALIRLVAIENGYGAKEVKGKIKTAA
jgi:hypothetical protein